MKIIKYFKILITIIVVFHITIYLINKYNVEADSQTKLYIVFNKQTYEKNEEVEIKFNLSGFSSLNEIKLQVKIKNEYFEPILNNDKAFIINNNAIFKNDIINDCLDNNLLRLHLIKNEIEDDNYSNYNNNIASLKLITKRPIDNIYNYFTNIDFTKMGLSLYLFNNNDEIINYEIIYNEKIDVEWNVDKYVVDVYSKLPDIKTDIVIKNRNTGEFEFVFENEESTNEIGLKTLHIGIYDKLSSDYVVFSKVLEVVDKTKPTIKINDTINIIDKNLEELNLLYYIECYDNYDKNLKLEYLYFQQNKTEIRSYQEFINYLKNNETAYLKVKCIDSSNNIQETPYILINIEDKTPPVINNIEEIEIIDSLIDQFDIINYIEILDDYDDNPVIIIENDEFSYKENLKKGISITIKYYGIDHNNNKTNEYSCILKPIDTISPIIITNDLTIKDIEYNKELIDNSVNVIDNFINKCNIIKTYYIDEREVSFDIFEKEILKGYLGIITYLAIDSNQNKSEQIQQNIQIIDTTIPVITIKNIKNNTKYTSLENIEYEVFDNFDNLKITILLDDEVYTKEKLVNISVGFHIFKILAIDSSGNESSSIVEFEIIENNIIGCGTDSLCYFNNYIELVIIVITILLIVITITIIKIIKYFKMKKRRQ